MSAFEVNLAWKESRKGMLTAPGLPDAITVATPPEFAGGMPGIWSPEHLFTASVSSCFMTTFLAIAENSKLQFTAFTCDAKGLLEQVDGKYRMTAVELYPRLTIVNAADREKAERVLNKSEKACLISNSISAAVSLVPEIHVGP